MKKNLVLASLLVSLAPLTTACVETNPAGIAPAEVMALGVLSAPGSTAKAPVVQAKKSADADHLLFPREATPFGTSYEDWAAAWWQWAASIPKDESPFYGAPCEQNQSGNVFFLVGTTGGDATRSCTIPSGKGIFFPIVNVMYVSCIEYANQWEGYTCDVATDEDLLHQWASEYMAYDHTMLLEIDGVSVDGLDAYGAHSETFTEASPADPNERVFNGCTGPIGANPCGVPVGSPRPAVADGYWAMLRPLPAGQHEIRFAASMDLPWGGFSLDVTYHLDVAP